MKTTGKKLFFWFMSLALILACAPSMVTPVPPLDRNDINIFIAQTAQAASTQTVAARPAPTLTPTFTATPRNTFTPEPSQTPFQTFALPSITPLSRLQLFRVKHDSQVAVYDYKSRTADKKWQGVTLLTPETVALFVDPNLTSGTNRTKLDGSWETYLNALNDNNEKKLRYLKADDTALFNTSGFPNLESLTMGGNVISVLEVRGNWARVNTIDYVSPGALKDVNYLTRPDLVQKFVVVAWKRDTKLTYWINPPHGDIYWPLVSSRPVWIPLDRIEPFPTLPMEVTANVTQEIRTEPRRDSSLTGHDVWEGKTVKIIDYHPAGPNVWGRLDSGGWIALLLDYKYPTTWKMETVPPP